MLKYLSITSDITQHTSYIYKIKVIFSCKNYGTFIFFPDLFNSLEYPNKQCNIEYTLDQVALNPSPASAVTSFVNLSKSLSLVSIPVK